MKAFGEEQHHYRHKTSRQLRKTMKINFKTLLDRVKRGRGSKEAYRETIRKVVGEESTLIPTQYIELIKTLP